MTRYGKWTMAALALGAPLAAAAHELECEKRVAILRTDAAGVPLLDGAGLPVPDVGPARILTLDRYPATLGFELVITNVADRPSVITGAADTLLDGLPGVAWYGTGLAPGFTVPFEGGVITWAAVRVESQEACLALGVGGPAAACHGVENRFVVDHDAGSGECRARVVCGSDRPWSLWPVSARDEDRLVDLAVDARGDVHAVGWTFAPILPTWSPGGASALVQSFTSAGWTSQRLSLAEPALARAVAVTPGGDRLVGWTREEGMIATSGVTRLARDGDEAWTAIVGAGASVYVLAVAIAPDGDVLATGLADSWAFLARLDGATGAVRAMTPLPLAAWAQPTGLAAGADGRVWVSGQDGDRLGALGRAGFVLRLGAAGDVEWITLLDDAPDERGANATSLALDAAGNAYVAGWTEAELGVPPNGSRDAFAACWAPDGTLRWLRMLGAAATDLATDVAVDAAGNATVVGWTAGAVPGWNETGAPRGLVFRLDPSGAVTWTRQVARSTETFLDDVALDSLGNAYVIGFRYGDPPAGPTGSFVEKLDPDGDVP